MKNVHLEMSGNPSTSTCPSSSITFGRVFSLFTCLINVIFQQINTWYLGIMFSIINARGRCSPHTVSKSDVCWFLSITHWHIVWNHFCNACIYFNCIHQQFCKKKCQIELLDQQKGSLRFRGQINYLAWTPILAHCAPPFRNFIAKLLQKSAAK